jgi:excisionase family DNA binding protein
MQSASDPAARASSTLGSGRRSYLRAAEAAALLHVSPKTISRWAREGKLGHVVTLGGHRRFSREDIEALADRMAISEDAGCDGLGAVSPVFGASEHRVRSGAECGLPTPRASLRVTAGGECDGRAPARRRAASTIVRIRLRPRSVATVAARHGKKWCAVHAPCRGVAMSLSYLSPFQSCSFPNFSPRPA